jgi:hypothetical protein
MAGPHVAGAVALLISAKPALAGQVEMIETLLEKTAQALTDTLNCANLRGANRPNAVYGFGRINVLAAVEEALRTTTPIDTPSRGKIALRLSPNPVTEGTVLVELGNLVTEGRLELLDVAGRLLQSQILGAAPFQSKTLTLGTLPAGTYFIRVLAGNTYGYQKLVKI